MLHSLPLRGCSCLSPGVRPCSPRELSLLGTTNSRSSLSCEPDTGLLNSQPPLRPLHQFYLKSMTLQRAVAVPQILSLQPLGAGTLTLNQLSVRGEDMLVMKGFSQQDAVRLGALSANNTTGEPIDVVLNEACPDRSALQWCEGHSSSRRRRGWF